MKTVLILTIALASSMASAKDRIITEKTVPVSVRITSETVDAPYFPFDGDVKLKIGDDFADQLLFPKRARELTAYFAPGNTRDVLLYNANRPDNPKKGELPALLNVRLIERITLGGRVDNSDGCFHCTIPVCVKGLVEDVSITFPAANDNQKTVVFEKRGGFETAAQEIPMQNCEGE